MKRNTFRTALGGVLSALALSAVFMGSVFPFSEYIGPVVASVCVLVFCTEFGIRSALLMYLGISLLSVFISPSIESSLLFAVFLGWYPAAKGPIEKKFKKPLSLAVKLILLNVCVLSLYYVLLNVLQLSALQEDFAENTVWMTALMIGMYNVTFLFYDRILTNVAYAYLHRFRPKLIR